MSKRDTDAFRDRLRRCVGSEPLSAFARRAGLPIATFRRYFRDSEPTRPKLLAIAKAAGVSVEWLATGFGTAPPESAPGAKSNSPSGASHQIQPEAVTAEQACAEVTSPVDPENAFRQRLASWVARHGGIQRLKSEVGVPLEVMERLSNDRPVPFDALAELARHSMVPLRWLVSTEPGYHGSLARHALPAARELLSKLGAIDDCRLFDGIRSGPDVEDGSWKRSVYAAMTKLYELLPPAHYQMHQVDGAFPSSIAAKGDIAVIHDQSRQAESGCYLFQQKEAHVVMSVSRIGGVLRVHPHEPGIRGEAINENTFKCIGKVAVLIRRFGV